MNSTGAQESQSQVSLESVSLSYGENTVLKNVSLDIPGGQFVVLLGRSGTGKSSLLRILSGLSSPSAGQIYVPEIISFAFQDSRLLPWKKVWENVTFGLNGQKFEQQLTAKNSLDEVALGDKAEAWPATLSGGEAQRVSLARALAREPDLLLLDEPFGALDALTRLSMHELVLKLLRKHKPTVIMVTHDVAEATHLADRILVLDEGNFVVDINVDKPHPRSPTDPELIAVQSRILEYLGVTQH